VRELGGSTGHRRNEQELGVEFLLNYKQHALSVSLSRNSSGFDTFFHSEVPIESFENFPE
jgi:hypothetical protein